MGHRSLLRSFIQSLGPASLAMFAVLAWTAALTTDASAQRRFARTFPAGQTVKIQLLNRSGTVTVEGWDRDQVQVSAYLEAPAATIEPQVSGGSIIINVVRDNQGKSGVGNVNFTIRVPYSLSVDIETMIGNLNVSNVRGSMVRAHISSEGDITLQNIAARNVYAENVIGDIFFDGEIAERGDYRFTSMRGNINLRIPFDASFRVIATAPSSRNISLGTFTSNTVNFVAEGRRVQGSVGGGGALIRITNQRGTINFLRR